MDIKVPQTFPIAPWNANLNKLFLIALEMIEYNLENSQMFVVMYQSYRLTCQHKVHGIDDNGAEKIEKAKTI